MGYLYEELIRRFSELSNETAGEHFTPREVIRLMVNLLFTEDDGRADQAGRRADALRPRLRDRRDVVGRRGPRSLPQPAARLEVFGQELNDETYAICRSDMMLKGQDASHIALRQQLHRGRLQGDLRLPAGQSALRRRVEEGRGRRPQGSREEGLRWPLRSRAATDQRRLVPVPAAHDLQDEAGPRKAGPASPSSSTARRCSPGRPGRASRRSGAGSSRTTGWRPSSRCPTSCSTTPASPPTSGS